MPHIAPGPDLHVLAVYRHRKSVTLELLRPGTRDVTTLHDQGPEAALLQTFQRGDLVRLRAG